MIVEKVDKNIMKNVLLWDALLYQTLKIFSQHHLCQHCLTTSNKTLKLYQSVKYNKEKKKDLLCNINTLSTLEYFIVYLLEIHMRAGNMICNTALQIKLLKEHLNHAI